MQDHGHGSFIGKSGANLTIPCTPPGSSVHGILQAEIVEWVAFPSPGDLHDPGMEPRSPTLQVNSLLTEQPGEPLQGHMVALFLLFEGTSILCSIVAVPIYTSTNNVGKLPSVHTLSRIYCLWIFYDKHPGWSKGISHSSFDLHFSNT